MKYSVEVTNNGYVETLEVNGKIYKKHWVSVNGDSSCRDDAFCKQMEKDGYGIEILTTVGADIDCSFFANDIFVIHKQIMESTEC